MVSARELFYWMGECRRKKYTGPTRGLIIFPDKYVEVDLTAYETYDIIKQTDFKVAIALAFNLQSGGWTVNWQKPYRTWKSFGDYSLEQIVEYKAETLTVAINDIVSAYYEEYTDATELDGEFYNALLLIWELCFQTGENSDGKTFEEVIQKQ